MSTDRPRRYGADMVKTSIMLQSINQRRERESSPESCERVFESRRARVLFTAKLVSNNIFAAQKNYCFKKLNL